MKRRHGILIPANHSSTSRSQKSSKLKTSGFGLSFGLPAVNSPTSYAKKFQADLIRSYLPKFDRPEITVTPIITSDLR